MIKRVLSVTELRAGVVCRVLGAAEATFQGISTDTREDLRGCLFWALVGEAHDAHAFVAQAVEKGATGIVVHKETPEITALARRATVILVPDTLVALQDLGNHVRRKLDVPVIGITGSNGKTSTKEFTAALISPYKKIHWSPGSFNNHWGVPFSILDAPADPEVLLLEMGMNHHGEIKTLCEIAEPTIVVCTLVGKTHMGHFGSVDEIARAKEEIYRHARPEAVRIYNLDNPWTAAMEKRAGDYPRAREILRYSRDPARKADVSLRLAGQDAQGVRVRGEIRGVSGEVTLPVIGAHHADNAMAAAAVALAAGVTPAQIWASLPDCRSAWGRMQLLRNDRNVSILFDGYNASPDSYRALLETVPVFAGASRLGAVFGEMKELGPAAEEEHRELGRRAGALPFATIWFYGPSAAAFRAGVESAGFRGELVTTEDYDDARAASIAAAQGAGALVLVKGSRGMATERFVKKLSPLGFAAKK